MGTEAETRTVPARVVFALDALREELGLEVHALAVRADMTGERLWALVNSDEAMTYAEAARLGMEMAFVLQCRDHLAVAGA